MSPGRSSAVLLSLLAVLTLASSQLLPYQTAPAYLLTFDNPIPPTSYTAATSIPPYTWTETIGSHHGLASYDGTTIASRATQITNLTLLTDAAGRAWPSVLGGSWSVELWLNVLSISAPTVIFDFSAANGAVQDNVILSVLPTGQAVVTVWVGSAVNSTLTTASVAVGGNVWQHVVISFAQLSLSDSSSNTSALYTVYINGARAGSMLGYLPASVSRPYSYINGMNAPSAGTAPLLGQIDQFAVYGYAMDAVAAQLHAIAVRPPVFELGLAINPHTAAQQPSTSTTDYNYTIPNYYTPHINTTNNATYYTSATSNTATIILNSALSQYIDLNAGGGLYGVGISLPAIGGAGGGGLGAGLDWDMAGGWSVEIVFALLAGGLSGSSTGTLMHLATSAAGVDDIELLFDTGACNNGTCSTRLQLQLWRDGQPVTVPVIGTVKPLFSYHVMIAIAPAGDVNGGLLSVYINGALTTHQAVFIYPRSVARTNSYIGRSANNSASVSTYTSLQLNLLRVLDYFVRAAHVSCLYSYAPLNTVNNTQLPTISTSTGCAALTNAWLQSPYPDYSIGFTSQPTSTVAFGWYTGDGAHSGLADFNALSTGPLLLTNYSEGTWFAVPTGAASWSIETWIEMPDQDAGQVSSLVEMSNAAGGQLISFAINTTSLPYGFELLIGGIAYTGPLTNFTTSAWQHVVLTVDNTHAFSSTTATLTLYVNGQQQYVTAIIPPPASYRANASLGKSLAGVASPLIAAVDSFAYYSQPLTAKSVALRSFLSRQPVYDLSFPIDPRTRLGYGLKPSIPVWTWSAVDTTDARHTGVLYIRNGANKGPGDSTAAYLDLANTAAGYAFGTGFQPPPTVGSPSAGVGVKAGWSMEFSFIAYNYNNWAKLFSCGDNTGGHGTIVLGLQSSSSLFQWQQCNYGNNCPGLTIIDPLPLNQWLHVVIVMQPSSQPSNAQSSIQSAYLNGQFVGVITSGFYPDAFNRYNCWVGRSTWGDSMMDAALDGLRMYDYALSPQEIASLATLALTNQVVPPVSTSAATNPVSSPPLTHTAPRAVYNFDIAHSYTGAGWYPGQQDPLSYMQRLGVLTLNGDHQWADLATWPDDYASFIHTQLFSSFSVEMWIKIYQSDAASQYTLFDIGSPRQGLDRSSSVSLAAVDQINNVYLSVSGGGALSFGLYGGSQAGTNAVAGSLTAGLWQHMVVSVNQSGVNNGSYAIFVQGVLVSDGSFTGVLAANLLRQHVYIGKSNIVNDTLLLSCQVDNLYVYDYALSTAAVSDHVWLPRQPVFELVFQSDPRWALNASSAVNYTYNWNVTCGLCYPNYVQPTVTLLSNCTNSTLPVYLNNTLTNQTTIVTNCSYSWLNTTGYQPNATNTYNATGVLILHNQYTTTTTTPSYQAAWADLTTTSGSSTVGSILPLVGDEAQGAVYTGWTFEVEVQFHVGNSSQLFPSWYKVFSMGSANDKVELIFQSNGTNPSYLGFQVVNERADSGHGSGNLYPLFAPQMDVWYHIVISVLYTGTTYAPYNAQYTAYVNGVAMTSFTTGAYPIKAARSFATLGTATPSGLASQAMVDSIMAVNTFRVYDVVVDPAAVSLMYDGLHSLPTSLPAQTPLYNAYALREYTFDSASSNSSWLDGTNYGYLPALGSHTGVLTFTGSQYVDLLSFDDNSQSTWPSVFGGPMTIELWVYHFGQPSLTSRILDMAGLAGAADNHIYLRNGPCPASGTITNTNSVVFGITNSANSSAVVCLSNATWTTGKWQHIAITIQPNTLGDSNSAQAATTTLYVNGQRIASLLTPLPAYASHFYCYISNSRDSAAGMNTTPYSSFEGAIDSLSLYNTPLPPESILAHYLVNPAAYFELNFNLDPRINYITNSTTASPLYNWLNYDPLDSPLPTKYNHHQGMIQLVQSAAQYQWIDLNKATGPNSAGVLIPVIGGASSSVQYSSAPGWSFEIVFKAGSRTSWAKMFCMGNAAYVDNILIGWDGEFTTNLTISFQSFDQYGNNQLLKVLTPTQFNRWYHLVIVIEPSGYQASYVDGVLTNFLTNGVYPRSVVRSESYLGKSEWIADSYFNMKLDTFRVYDTALTPAQIGLLYSATLPDVYVAPVSSSSSSSSTGVVQNGAVAGRSGGGGGGWLGWLSAVVAVAVVQVCVG